MNCRGRSWRRKAAVTAVFVASLFSLLVFAVIASTSPKPLVALVPENTAGVTVLDGHWLWDATSGIRSLSDVQAGMNMLAQSAHVDLNQDLAPWLGQIALFEAGTSNGTSDLPVVLALQIKDQDSFGRFLAAVQQDMSATGAPVTSKTVTYDGISITQLVFKVDNKRGMASGRPYSGPGIVRNGFMEVDIAVLPGWAVVSDGVSHVERVIDTYSGKYPSFQGTRIWARLQSVASADPVEWHWYDTKKMESVFPRKVTAKMGFTSGLLYSCVGASYDDGNGFHSMVTTTPDDPHSIAVLAHLKANCSAVSNAVLKEVPDADIALLVNDPYGWFVRGSRFIAPYMAAMHNQSYDQFMHGVTPFMSYVKPFTGPFGVTVVWRKGVGFGAVIVAHLSTPGAAERSAGLIGQMLAGMQAGGGENSFGESDYKISFAPAVTVHSNVLYLATNVVWLTGAKGGVSHLSVPSSPSSPDFVLLGDFRPIPSVISALQSSPKANNPDSQMAIQIIQALGLQDATWNAASGISPDGSGVKELASIKNWDWRTALANTAQIVDKSIQAHQHQAPNTPPPPTAAAPPTVTAVPAAAGA